MANWCSNWVNLSGEPEAIKAFMQDIQDLNKKSIETQLGVSCLDDKDCDGYMFDFDVDTDSFSFESKWSPVIDSLKFLAKKHGVAVTNRYEELSGGIYGEWSSDGDSETDTCLTDVEIDSVIEDEETCIWSFEDEKSECREELLSVVLERKMKLAV